MGLAERRAAKKFETEKFTQLKQEVEAAAGFPVPLEVAWDELAKDGESHLYEECWPKVYFQPLIAALQEIAVDDMGKEALKGGLKQIKVQNKEGIYSGHRIASFEGGVLTLDHEPHTNVDDVKDRQNGIRSTLEAKL